MKEASKRRSYPEAGDNIPVSIRGYIRRWNAPGKSIGYSTTFLGVAVDEDSSFNGIVFKFASANHVNGSGTLRSYDLREEWYCRQLIPLNKLSFYDAAKNGSLTEVEPDGQYWIYVNRPEFTDRPNAEYPIVQSYVDIFVSGCIELEEKFSIPDFAETCVEGTQGWSSSWVNDRIYPRRPFIFEPRAAAIDKLLALKVPKHFGKIKIEG
jgi:hypothetical protein